MCQIHLFTSFYKETEADRAKELLECLGRNLNSGVFHSVNLLLENVDSPISHDRLTTRNINHRPTYSDFFRWQREVIGDKKNISVIANSDIYFDQSIFALKEEIDQNTCCALSRWNCLGNNNSQLYDHNDSQDSWIFFGAIKETVVGDFPLGIPRCDNRILYELQSAGYRVLNPAFSIRSYHLHSEISRTYSNENQGHFVDPPYRYLWPHNLWKLPKTIAHNRASPNSHVGWRIDRRKIAATLPVRAVRKIARTLGIQS